MNIRADEWSKVGFLCLHVLACTAVLILSRTLINAVFLNTYSAEYLPYVFAVQAAFFVTLSFMYSWLAGRLSRRWLVNSLLMAFLVSLVAWRAALLLDLHWVVFAFYVWMETLSLLMVMQSWLIVNDSLDTRQGKRLFPLVQGGGTLGAVMGGLLSSILAGAVGTENMLFCFFPLILVAMISGEILLSRHVSVSSTVNVNHGSAAKGILSRLDSMRRMILEDRFLAMLLVIFVCVSVSSTLLDFQFKSIMKARFTEDEIASFLGTFYAVVNPCTLVVLLLFANRLLMSLGIAFGLAVIPLCVLSGSALFLCLPLFWVLLTTRFMEEVSRFSIRRPSWELAYVPYPSDRKRAISILFNGVVGPLCVFLASMILIVSAGIISVRMLSLIMGLLCAIAVGACVSLRGPYAARLRESLSSRSIRLGNVDTLQDLVDRQGLQLIEQSMASSDINNVLFSLNLVGEYHLPVNLDRVELLYAHRDAAVRAAAVDVVAQSGESERVKKVQTLLAADKDPDVCRACLNAMAILNRSNSHELLIPYLSNPSREVRVQAIISLVNSGEIDGMIAGAEELRKLLRSEDSRDLKMAAESIGALESRFLARSLGNLFANPDYEVRAAAVKAAGATGSPDLLPRLIDCLSDRRLTVAAREAISRYSCDSVPAIVESYVLRDSGLHLRLHLIRVLGHFPCADTVKFLVNILRAGDSMEARQALDSLSRLRRKHDLDMSDQCRVVADCVRSHLETGYRLYYVMGRLGNDHGNEFLRDEILAATGEMRETVLKMLALAHDHATIHKAMLNIMSGNALCRSNALELLDTVLDRRQARILIPFLEDLPPDEMLSLVSGQPGFDVPVSGEWSDILVQTGNEWLMEVAAWSKVAGQPVKKDDDAKRRKDMMPLLEKVYFLKGVPLLSGISGKVIRQLAGVFREEHLERNTRVFSEGDPGDSFYIVLQGSIRAERSGMEVAVLGEKDCFGEVALLDYAPRTASATTLEETRLLCLEKEDFQDLMDEYPEIARGIMRVLAQRLRSTLATVHEGL